MPYSTRSICIRCIFFHDELITRIDYQTLECILVGPFDLLSELLGNDEEVRLHIDYHLI
jgi:hypothetical protein